MLSSGSWSMLSSGSWSRRKPDERRSTNFSKIMSIVESSSINETFKVEAAEETDDSSSSTSRAAVIVDSTAWRSSMVYSTLFDVSMFSLLSIDSLPTTAFGATAG